MNIVIAIPCYGEQVSVVTTESIALTVQALVQEGHTVNFIKSSYYDVASARNMLLSAWYFNYPQSSHLLFVDSDIGFSPQMIIDMLAEGVDVVGTTFPMRRIDLVRFHALARTGATVGACKNKSMDWVGVLPEKPASFVPVDKMGGAVLCIDRIGITQLITKTAGLLQPFGIDNPFNLNQLIMAFTPTKLVPIPDSEIYSFCWRIKQAGGSLRMATTYPITHVGSFNYEGTRVSYP